MDWYLEVLKKYAVFEGRARRKEFWFFALFNMIIALFLALIGIALIGNAVLSSIYSLAVLIPNVAVWVRRLHDTDRSGWWMLLSLVPFIGIIILVIFAVMDSTPGQNRFGPNPKG